MSTNFSCSIELKTRGYMVVPTRSTVLVSKGCQDLLIRVKGKLPGEVRPWYRDYGLGSFRPYLELKKESGLVKVVELIEGKERIWFADNEGNGEHSENGEHKEGEDDREFSSLQEALDFTKAGSTLEVPFGHYFESLNITKPVRIVGYRKAIIFGSILIYSHDVVLDGLSIFSLEALKPSIEVHFASGVTIHNCRLEQGSYVHSDLHAKETVAVFLSHSSRVAFVNSRVVGFGIGLELQNCTECVLQSNWIQSCWVAVSLVHSCDAQIQSSLFRENDVISAADGAGLQSLLAGSNVFQDNVQLTFDHEGPQEMGRFRRQVPGEPQVFESTAMVMGSCLAMSENETTCAGSRAGL